MERAFHAYREPLDKVTLFKYLVRVLTSWGDNWSAVAGNLRKDRKIWLLLEEDSTIYPPPPPPPPRLPPGEPSRNPVLKYAQSPLHPGGKDASLCPERQHLLHD